MSNLVSFYHLFFAFVLLQHFGSLDPDRLIDQITYMATGEECDVIFLDHLSLVVSGLSDGDERKQNRRVTRNVGHKQTESMQNKLINCTD